MKIFENIQHWITFRDEVKWHGLSIGFVPTMGALHDGHISLVKKSKAENDHTVVSIFVNPTQFNSAEDLENYPRQIESDLRRLQEAQVDAVIVPHQNEVYAQGLNFQIKVEASSQILCGQHRPGHFAGVLTVVMKLLGIAGANRCYMGEKDYQQFILVQNMAKSFFLPTAIVPCPIVRESSGLAMSSRNMRLSEAGRIHAAEIYNSLKKYSSVQDVQRALTELNFKVEYVEDHWQRRFVAAWLEKVRLIDNVPL